MVGLDEDQGVREQVIEHVRVLAEHPRIGGRRREIFDRALGKDVAEVRADRIDETDVVEEHRKDRILVHRTQVIALEEDVDRELPRQGAFLAHW